MITTILMIIDSKVSKTTCNRSFQQISWNVRYSRRFGVYDCYFYAIANKIPTGSASTHYDVIQQWGITVQASERHHRCQWLEIVFVYWSETETIDDFVHCLCINACYINCKKMVIPVWSRVVTSNRYNSVEHPITTRKPRLKQARPFAPTTLTWQRYSWQWSWQERTWGQDLAQTVCRFCWPRALGGLSCADSRPPSGWGRGRMCPHVSHRAEDDMWSCSTRSNRLYSVI